MKITLRHYASNHEIKCKQGFSWTTLFFGCLPALFRGDLKWAAIMFVVHLLIGIATFGFGLIVTYIIFACIYNNRYIRDLGKKGYLKVDERLTAGEYRVKPEGRPL